MKYKYYFFKRKHPDNIKEKSIELCEAYIDFFEEDLNTFTYWVRAKKIIYH